MRLLVLTPYPYGTAPGPRSSFELWERVLAQAGIELRYAVFDFCEVVDADLAVGDGGWLGWGARVERR